ncbi:MAG: hypothetical protein K8R48_10550 [Alphaproteobacteria bacterium]|nr:hypothetical protein [Alphaproteobacteria bacterium]
MTKKITNNPLQQAAIDKVMQIVLGGGDDSNIEQLIKAAGPGLASHFSFTLTRMGGLLAIVMPAGSDDVAESKKSCPVMKHFFPKAEYVDDCVVGLWSFPAEIDTPAKLAETLLGQGFVFDKKNQEPGLMKELASVIGSSEVKPKKKTQGPKN